MLDQRPIVVAILAMCAAGTSALALHFEAQTRAAAVLIGFAISTAMIAALIAAEPHFR